MNDISRTREAGKTKYDHYIPPSEAAPVTYRVVLAGTLMNCIRPDLDSAHVAARVYLERKPDGKCLIYKSEETLVEEVFGKK